MPYPPVVIVDEYDREIGHAMLAEVWQNGWYHRIARVVVEDEDGRILLQKRPQHMKLWPGCWDMSAAGHVDKDVSYEQAAADELNEELGVSDALLTEVAWYKTNGVENGRILNRFNKVYRTIAPAGTRFAFDPEEVDSVRWFTWEELLRLAHDHPEQITDGVAWLVAHYHAPVPA
ncbi:MAG TPA: NUDIX domain-containing protein [Candidatus Saccharimonadales bacterium]|nr:NUDIX domain-containing protein [Candidatus Saccharimonadales bacterium]